MMRPQRVAASKRSWRIEDVQDDEPKQKKRRRFDDSDYEDESDERRGKRPGSRPSKRLISIHASDDVPRGEGGVNSRWNLLMSFGADLWPQLAAASEVQSIVMNHLLRLDAMRFSKWFQDLPNDCSKLSEVDLAAFRNILRDKAVLIETQIIAEEKSFKGSCFSDLAMWIEYCQTAHEGDLAVNSLEKVRAYIPFRVECAMDNRRRCVVQRALPEETASRAARFVQSRIGKLAELQGWFKAKELTEHESISTMVESYRLQAVRARAEPRDFAGSSRVITKDINTDEDGALKQTFWSGVYSQHLASMRTYLLYMINSTAGRRGHELREMYMGMLLMRTVEAIQPVKGNVVVASIRHMKNCYNNFEHIITWIRHVNVIDCPTGALANYMVYILDIAKHPLFDIMTEDLTRQINWAKRGKQGDPPKSKWWGLRLAYSTDRQDGREPFYDEISDTTHLNGFNDALAANGITGKTAKTHLQRHKVLIDNTEKGVPLIESAKFQDWSTMEVSGAINAYLSTAVKSIPLLVSHGWKDVNHYMCWRQTEEGEMDEQLLCQVLPRLDNIMKLAEDAYELSGLDLSAVEFCKVLKYLRRVVLEDAVYMKEEFKSFPTFQHPVFDTVEWSVWKERAVERAEQVSEAHAAVNKDVDMQRVMSLMRNNAVRMEKKLEEAMAKVIVAAPATPSFAPTPPPPPPVADPVNRVPFIMENVASLRYMYKEWDSVLRPYFSQNGNPPWLATFGQTQQAQKTRYIKLENTCLYIDYVATVHQKDPRKVVVSLEKVAKYVGQDHHKFVTQSMYGLIQWTGQSGKRAKTADEENLQTALMAEGLPAPSMPAKELRKALQWKNRGVRCKPTS